MDGWNRFVRVLVVILLNLLLWDSHAAVFCSTLSCFHFFLTSLSVSLICPLCCGYLALFCLAWCCYMRSS